MTTPNTPNPERLSAIAEGHRLAAQDLEARAERAQNPRVSYALKLAAESQLKTACRKAALAEQLRQVALREAS